MPNFPSAWRDAQPIPGWLAEEEARLLFHCAAQIPSETSILEVGTYRGKSAALLAHTNRPVVTIDPMAVGDDSANRVAIADADVQELKRLVARYPNLRWLRTTSADCPLPAETIGLLYVDGDHQYPAPLHDYLHFEARLQPGSFVAFHDFGVFGGVTQAVQELEREGKLVGGRAVGSMYVARQAPCDEPVPLPLQDKAVESKDSVAGFHLIVLCHRFGRRGRAFAASLAKQIDNPYRLRLTCFFHHRRDAEFILDGAEAGEGLSELSLVRLPDHRIMQRAMHFSSVAHDRSLSHVVFLDCDLWFPPTFWRDYGAAIGREPPGYWSAHIRDALDQSDRSFYGRRQLDKRRRV